MFHRKEKAQEVKAPKKAFAEFLSDDEEMVLATGFGKNYMRHKFIYLLLWPGGIPFVLATGLAYYANMNLGAGMLIGLVLSTIWALILTIWHYHANRYILTTRRVIIKRGLISVKLISALYDKITHIEVDQGIMDRLIMKHGNIVVNTAGGNGDEIKITAIDEPIKFKNLLERLINRERERFGGQSGPVVTLEGELVD